MAVAVGEAVKRLNFGCGSIQPEGWVNVDVEDFGQEHVGSTELFADHEFDIVVAHCVLQTFLHEQWPKVLEELRRITRQTGPGDTGLLRISLPDIERGFQAHRDDDIDWFPNNESNIDDRFSNWLTWYSTTRTLLTPIAALHQVKRAGWRRVAQHRFRQSLRHEAAELDTRKGECFFIEGLA